MGARGRLVCSSRAVTWGDVVVVLASSLACAAASVAGLDAQPLGTRSEEGSLHEGGCMQNVTMLDLWTYRDRSDLGSNVVDTHPDLTGFGVEAIDGSIGKVDEATYDVGRSYLV